MNPDKETKKVLAKPLEKLAHEQVDMTPDGEPLTRAQKLARIVWDGALGHEELNKTTGKTEKIPPCQWYINLLFDRLEGKTITKVVTKGKDRVPIAERVSALSKVKMNKLAESQ